MTEQKPPAPNNDQAARRLGTWWTVILILLVLWNVFAWFPRAHRELAESYSTFLTQVDAGNVKSVRIVGDQITGNFAKPVASNGTNYSAFSTTFPATVGDPGLVARLTAHHAAIDVSSPSAPWFVQIFASWLPTLLLIGFFVWLMASAGKQQAGLIGAFGRSKAKRYTEERPKVSFDDVAGVDEAKQELKEEVTFLRSPEKYHAVGARIPRGTLLVGPPGTGKTLLARAVAGEANVPFFSMNASEFVELFVGVGASRVRDLFAQAKEAAPAIVFIDEIDAVGRRRGAGVGMVNDEREQTLNQLLAELDGFDPRSNVIIMAATNRADVLDPALLRPGRFDRQVTVDLPDRPGREAILRIHARKLPLGPDVDFGALAGATIGMSGADLENLCNEAALSAARHDRQRVLMSDFEEAEDRVRLGAAHVTLLDPEERRVVAYHEAGHTVAAWFTPRADPVRKVTIVAHGQALGLTEAIPDRDARNLSESYLKARLVMMLAGRTAEEIVFGEISTGAENDLVEATKLARQMVTTWGMSDLGPIAFASDEQQPFLGYRLTEGRDYSDATAARIDESIKALLQSAHEEAHARLMSERARLDALAGALLQHETIAGDELARILGPRAQPVRDGAATVARSSG
jgi:cell division protease FtsH